MICNSQRNKFTGLARQLLNSFGQSPVQPLIFDHKIDICIGVKFSICLDYHHVSSSGVTLMQLLSLKKLNLNENDILALVFKTNLVLKHIGRTNKHCILKQMM